MDQVLTLIGVCKYMFLFWLWLKTILKEFWCVYQILCNSPARDFQETQKDYYFLTLPCKGHKTMLYLTKFPCIMLPRILALIHNLYETIWCIFNKLRALLMRSVQNQRILPKQFGNIKNLLHIRCFLTLGLKNWLWTCIRPTQYTLWDILEKIDLHPPRPHQQNSCFPPIPPPLPEMRAQLRGQ